MNLKKKVNNKNRAFYNSADIMHLEKMATEKSIEFLQNAFESSNIQLSDEIAHQSIHRKKLLFALSQDAKEPRSIIARNNLNHQLV